MRVALGVIAIAAGFAAVLVSAAGGGSTPTPAATVTLVAPLPLQPAPPIQVVDERPPDDMASDWSPDPVLSDPSTFTTDVTQTCSTSATGETCTSTDTCSSSASGQACTAGVWWSVPTGAGQALTVTSTPADQGQLAQLEQQAQQAAAAVQPAAPPRVIAKLDLGAGAEEVFAVWRNGAGQVCTDSEEVDSSGSNGGNGPSGPCMAATTASLCAGSCAQTLPDCSDALCLTSSDESIDGVRPRYVLTGTVDARADQLRVTDASGVTHAYPLIGPVVPATNLRVFMLDLGASDWRRLELISGTDLIAAQEMPLFQARSEECNKQVALPAFGTTDGSSLPSDAALQQQFEAWSLAIDACMRAGGADLGAGTNWENAAPSSLTTIGSGIFSIPAPPSP